MKLLPNGEILFYFSDTESKKNYSRSVITVEGVYSFGLRKLRKAISPMPIHLHPDCYEIFYVTHGSLQITSALIQHTLSKGDALIVRPGTLHSSGDQPITAHDGYYFQIRREGPILELGDDWSEMIHTRLSHSENRLLHPSVDLSELFESVLSGVASQNTFRRRRASAALLEVLYRLFECDEFRKTRQFSPQIERATEYIAAHIRERLTLEAVASYCGMSLSAFKHRFSEEASESPMAYINKLRIEEAKRLLEQGWSVTDTAYELDFTSSNYFSVVFKRMTSITASQYREQHYSK